MKRSNIIILILTSTTAAFIFLWLKSPEQNWEPWATLLNAVAVPLVYMFKGSLDGIEKPIEKANLNLELKSAQIKYSESRADYMAQINIWIVSHNHSSTIHSIYLKKNGSFFSGNDIDPYSKKGQKVNVVYPELTDQLTVDLGTFIKKEKDRERFNASALEISQDKVFKFSLLLLITAERYMDGFEEFHPNDWKLVFEYNLNKQLELPLTFDIHDSNPKRAIKWEPEGFSK
ncbi:hypothetical protein [uncultured Roseivirga sp.]|uniref:hypothetical protein n=1 Tax=uncultured Roseivirga sp. TaxID=543088 RepID=UPI0030DB6E98|tara:strand:- start:57 stop:749 length:693 start_codon:yes stop_codon:yes gene_type:complete